jgi:hypothetical protein
MSHGPGNRPIQNRNGFCLLLACGLRLDPAWEYMQEITPQISRGLFVPNGTGTIVPAP